MNEKKGTVNTVQSNIEAATARTIVMILGGGQGSRLHPLTKERSKPAVPVAGKFRLIDLTLSNCLHSGMDKIYVLTQFNSDSLHRHITQTYRFDTFSSGFVQILAAQQTPDNADWYQGTADAVRHAMRRLVRHTPEHIVILSGDHLYRMDYRALLKTHLDSKADATVGALPIERNRCSDFGILQVDEKSKITSFVEKPQKDEELEALKVPRQLFDRYGVDPGNREHIASMGIYIFRTEALYDVLSNTKESDFGRNIIPALIKNKKVVAHFFDGYWEDIGTIRSFFEANLSLTSTVPVFNFYDEQWPIFTRSSFLPGAKINDASTRSSLICDGAIISGAAVERSIIGVRGIIFENAQIYDTIMMGADYYDHQESVKIEMVPDDAPPLGIGARTIIRNAIIDKNARIGSDCRILNEAGIQDKQEDNYSIRDGIVVINKSAIIPNGTII